MASKLEPKASVASSPTTCAACSKRYSDPRLLPCLHSFCLACVKEKLLLEGGEGAGGKVCCVTCEHTAPLPEKGAEGLPQNVHLSYETEIAEYVRKIESEECLNCDECDRSEPQPITSFCCTCRGFLCTDCDHQHTISRRLKTHKIFTLEEAREMKDFAKELKQFVAPPPVTCPQHNHLEISIFCTTCSMLVCMQCTVVTHQGHKFEELPAFAETKRMEAEKGKGKISDAVSKIDAVITQGKAVLKQVDTRKNEVDDTIRDKFQLVYKLMQDREKKLMAENAEIAKVKSQRLTAQILELSSLKEQIAVCSGTVAEAQESHSDTEFLSISTTLQARLEELSQQFEQTPLKLQENAVITVSVDTATLVSEVAKLGRVATKNDVYKSLSEPVMTIKSNDPRYIAVHDSGDIFVSDVTGHCVHVYDQKGAEKRTIGSKSDGDGQFNGPVGVAIKGDVLYVAENHNHRVQKLMLDGKFISKFGKIGSGDGELRNPWGCTVSGDGKVYVADAGNSRVQVFNPDGTFSHTIKTGDTSDVAIDTEGNLHIAMYSAQSIKVTTLGGELVREYGGGQLQDPRGVAVDEDGYCLVGDWTGRALHIFDPQGKPVHSIEHTGWVCGVTLDKEGSVYVVEHGSNAVHKYTPNL